jgi:hypothetical protein
MKEYDLMKKYLTTLILLPQLAFCAPFLTLSDEFSSEHKFAYAITGAIDVKNSDKVFRYTTKDEGNYDSYNFFSASPTLRYKLNDNLLINSTVGGSYSQISGFKNEGNYSNNKWDFDSLALGLIYKFKTNSDFNKIFSLDIYPIQKYGNDLNYMKSIGVRLSIDKTYDPLVTSLQLGTLLSKEITFQGGKYQPANQFYVQPKVDFLANSLFSLGFGTKLSLLQEENFNKKVTRNSTVENRLLFSLAHTLDIKRRWYVEASFDTSGKSGGSLAFTFDSDFF